MGKSMNLFKKKSKSYNIFVWGASLESYALVKKISESNKVKNLYTNNDFFAEREAGYKFFANQESVRQDIGLLLDFAKRKEIDIFICDWKHNTQGVIEAFESININTIGVNKKWANLETRKDIGKQFMRINKILTADYVVVENENDYKANINKFGYPVVVKANGPALGLGAYICHNEEEAEDAYKRINSGEAYPVQEKIIIEEFLEGVEFDIISLWDGKTLLPLLPFKDYKLRFEGNKGLNTGSMGQYFPFEIPKKYQSAVNAYIKKLERALRRHKVNYKGAIYSALMVNDKGVYCLEYNMRIGLTEAPLFTIHSNNDFVDILEAILQQKLNKLKLQWKPGKAACINIVANEYPYSTKQIVEINFDAVNKLEEAGINVFHSFLKPQEDNKVSVPGLIALCLAKSSQSPLEEIYEQLNNIDFEKNFVNCSYRTDIGTNYLSQK